VGGTVDFIELVDDAVDEIDVVETLWDVEGAEVGIGFGDDVRDGVVIVVTTLNVVEGGRGDVVNLLVGVSPCRVVGRIVWNVVAGVIGGVAAGVTGVVVWNVTGDFVVVVIVVVIGHFGQLKLESRLVEHFVGTYLPRTQLL